MEGKEQNIQEKKVGRPKGSKSIFVIAFKREDLEFGGIYPSARKAATILFENPNMGPSVYECAKGKKISSKGYIFFELELNGGFTTEIMKEYKEKARIRLSQNQGINFTVKMVRMMDPEDLDTIRELYSKYNKE